MPIPLKCPLCRTILAVSHDYGRFAYACPDCGSRFYIRNNEPEEIYFRDIYEELGLEPDASQEEIESSIEESPIDRVIKYVRKYVLPPGKREEYDSLYNAPRLDVWDETRHGKLALEGDTPSASPHHVDGHTDGVDIYQEEIREKTAVRRVSDFKGSRRAMTAGFVVRNDLDAPTHDIWLNVYGAILGGAIGLSFGNILVTLAGLIIGAIAFGFIRGRMAPVMSFALRIAAIGSVIGYFVMYVPYHERGVHEHFILYFIVGSCVGAVITILISLWSLIGTIRERPVSVDDIEVPPAGLLISGVMVVAMGAVLAGVQRENEAWLWLWYLTAYLAIDLIITLYIRAKRKLAA